MRRKINESRSAGSGTVTIGIKADALEVELDAATTLAGPAQAAARAIGAGIARVGAAASASTVRQRRAQGISSDRRWNATGKLAGSVTAQREGKSFAIVVATDRLQDPELVELLAADVPELDAPVTAEVDRAIGDAVDRMFTVRRR